MTDKNKLHLFIEGCLLSYYLNNVGFGGIENVLMKTKIILLWSDIMVTKELSNT